MAKNNTAIKQKQMKYYKIIINIKKIICFLILALIAFNSIAQDNLDSLQNRFYEHIEQVGEDTIAIKLLEKIYIETSKVAPYIALEYAAQGKQIAENIGDSIWIAKMNQYIGNVYYHNKVFYLAMESYFKAYEIFVNHHNKHDIATILLDIGRTYMAQEVFDLAEEYFERSRKMFQQINDYEGLSHALENIGIINLKFDEEYSLELFFRALELRDSIGKKILSADIKLQIAIAYKQIAEIDSALLMLNESLKTYKNLKEDYKIAETYFLIGDVYLYDDNFSKSFYFLKLAMGYYQNLKHDTKLAEVYNKICEISQQQNNYSLTLFYATKALNIGEMYANLAIKKEACKHLSSAYEKLNKFEKSLYFQKRYSSITDSVFQEKKRRQFSEFQVSLETQKQQKEIELLQITAEKDRLKLAQEQYRRNLIFTITIALLILAFIVIFYFRYREKAKNNMLLSEKNKQMQKEIQERKLAESELRNSEEKYRLLFRKTPVGIMQFDENMSIVTINDRFAQIFKLNKKQVVGRSVYSIFDKNILSGFETALENKGRIFREERQIKTRADDVYVSLTIKPYYYSTGTEVEKGGIMIVEDITERKKAEISFHESETKNRALIQLIPDIIFLLNQDGDYLEARIPNFPDANKKYQGKNIKDVLPSDLLKKYMDVFQKTIETHKTQFLEYPLLVNNEIKYYEARFVVSNDNNIMLIVRDITRQKETEQSLKESKQLAESASKAKSEFIANISHEIRTPLNSILGFTELLMTKITHNKKYIEYLTSIKNNGKQLLDIINDILNLSSIETGKEKVSKEPASAEKVLKDIEKVFKQKANEKGIELKVTLDKKIPYKLLIDEVRLRQILFNLVGNAIKFTSKGSVELKLKSKKSEQDTRSKIDYIDLIFEVKDTGKGIAPEKIQGIFDDFSQEQNDNKRKFGGVGLGLSVTKRLVNQIGGSIKVESIENSGSTFSVIVPQVTIIQEQPFVIENQKEVKIEFDSSLVFLLTENKKNIEPIINLLKQLNIDTHIINKLNIDIYNLIESKLPDLIIFDNKLESSKLPELYKKIKKSDRSLIRTLPILVFMSDKMFENQYLNNINIQDEINYNINEEKLSSILKKYLSYTQLHINKSEEKINDEALFTINENENKKKSKKQENQEKLYNKDFIEDYESKIIPLFESLQKRISFNLLRNFSEQFKVIGEKYKIKRIIEISKKLSEQINNFDVSSINKTLDDIQKITEQMNEPKNKT